LKEHGIIYLEFRRRQKEKMVEEILGVINDNNGMLASKLDG